MFAAWGKSCLIAGDLASAREKFSKSYDTDHSTLKGIKSPSKLKEIIKILESRSDSIDEELLLKHQKLLEAGQAPTQSDRAVFILSKLKNLHNITSGNYATDKGKTTRKPKLHNTIYQECVYYLDKYGTACNLVEFHIKYEQFAKAVDIMNKKRLPADEFVDIYMKCLKVGSVAVLQAEMSDVDPSLCIWKVQKHFFVWALPTPTKNPGILGLPSEDLSPLDPAELVSQSLSASTIHGRLRASRNELRQVLRG